MGRAIEHLLYSHAAIHRDYGYFERPKFRPERSKKNPDFDWKKLKQTFQPYIQITPASAYAQFPEIIFTDKDVGWSTRDINIWIGSESRRIFELDDLKDAEGSVFFEIGLGLCRDLSIQTRINHSMTVGFNALDVGKPGHHNVNWLHSHIRAYDYEPDISTIVPRSWQSMNWFDRLMFIDPFSQLYFDFLKFLSETRDLSTFHLESASLSHGVIKSKVETDDIGQLSRDIKLMYSEMKSEYEAVEAVFTDRDLDHSTNRYIPLDKRTRHKRLTSFLSERSFYTPKSRQLLEYLGNHLMRAENQSSVRENHVENAAQVHITKGVAGAIAIVYELDKDSFRFEFFPRVITTNAAAKTMFGADKPTIMGKHVPATEDQLRSVEEYKLLILDNVLAMDFIRGTVSSDLIPVR